MSFSPYSDQDWKTYQAQSKELETDSSKLLKEFAQKAEEAGVTTEFVQEVGNAGPAICELSKAWKADLIVVGSHGRKGLSEMLIGSVSNYVVHHAPVLSWSFAISKALTGSGLSLVVLLTSAHSRMLKLLSSGRYSLGGQNS